VVVARPNDYRFVGDRAVAASRTYGVGSLSIDATRA
jgi:hypothetical protein